MLVNLNFHPQIEELTKKYAELEEKLVELRNLSRAEVTSFLDDEIGSRLDKLSRQVARIDKRLYTYHEVCAMLCKGSLLVCGVSKVGQIRLHINEVEY